MKLENGSKNILILENTAANTQIHMIVDGCKVKLNFPLTSGNTPIGDVKRMMLGGAFKA